MPDRSNKIALPAPTTSVPDSIAPMVPREAAPPLGVWVLDRLFGLAALAALTWAVVHGSISAEAYIAALSGLGVSHYGVRALTNSRQLPAGLGVFGLLILSGLALHLPVAAAAWRAVAAVPVVGTVVRRAAATLAAGAVALACLVGPMGCTPRPVLPSDATVQVQSSWTQEARVVLSTVSWIVPAARGVLGVILPDPARAIVSRALDGVSDAASRLSSALDAYDARGGDRCAAHAAAGAVVVALEELAGVLTDQGVAFGVPLGRLLDGAASLVDELAPACAIDAGWSAAGDSANHLVGALEDSARRRGVALRRDLDTLRPLDAGTP